MLGLQGDQWSDRAVRDAIRVPALWTLRMLALIIAVMVTWRARTIRRTIRAWGWTVFAWLTIGQSWFWPWYVTWLIVPAALVGSARLRNATLLLGITSMVMYVLDSPLGVHSSEPVIWGGAMIMGPPLVYVGVSLLLERRKKRVGVKSRSQAAGPQERQVVTSQG
jgi:hypothetical protein